MVSVDTVYQRVLALANKEQRGYITPQEFNLLANQAQMSIFEQYFHEIDQLKSYAGNETYYADPLTMVEEKLQRFGRVDGIPATSSYNLAYPNASPTNISLPITPGEDETYMYRIDYVIVNGREAERLNTKDYKRTFRSPLTRATKERPIYYVRDNIIRVDNGVSVDPTEQDLAIWYYKKPNKVNWGYVVTLGEAMYNASNSSDFDLHASEEELLVVKILEMAGITINKPGLVQIAAQEEADITSKQKLKQ
jgi:hypothetical protein